MDGDDSDRNELMQRLMGMIAGDLASRKPDELEGLIESISTFKASQVPSMLVSGNHAAMVFLHPEAEQEAAVAGLRETADWVEANWAKLQDRKASKQEVAAEKPAELLN